MVLIIMQLVLIQFLQYKTQTQLTNMQRSSQPQSYPHRNKLEILSPDQQSSAHHRSSQLSRSNFRKTGNSPFPLSHQQLYQDKYLNIQKQRHSHLSALIQPQKLPRYEQKSIGKEIDHSSMYLKQIDSISTKKRARYYYLRQRKAEEINQDTDQLKGKEKQDKQQPKIKVSQSTQPAISLPLPQKEALQEQGLQEMHYQMVKTQQHYKHIIKR